MRTLVIALTLAATAAPASAAEWWWVATTKDRDVIFLDRETIAPVPMASRTLKSAKVRVVRRFNTAGATGPEHYLVYFECNDRHTGPGSSIFNDTDLAPPTAATIAAKEARLGPALPGTGDPEKLKFACNVGRIIEGEPYYSRQGSDFYGVPDVDASAPTFAAYYDRGR